MESNGKNSKCSLAKRHKEASAARTYLDEHNLVEFAQSLLQSVIKEKPEHPYTFMAKQFHVPDTKPRPNTCPPILPAAMPMAALTPGMAAAVSSSAAPPPKMF